MKNFKKIFPICLFGITASFGIVFTNYLSIKTTMEIKDVERSLRHHAEDENFKYFIKKHWKKYIPTFLIMSGTIGCICCSGIYSSKSISSLMNVCSILNMRYTDYTNKVKELYGEKTHKKILNNINIEKTKDVKINAETLIGYLDNDLDEISEDEALFYDEISKRFFKTTKSKVLDAEIHLNRNFTLGAFPTINDFYNFLGLKPIDSGNILGWTNANGFYWLDFIHRKRFLPDGTVFFSITPYFSPSTDFLEDI